MDEHQIEIVEIQDAKKETISAQKGIDLALQATGIRAAKGKKIVAFSCRAGRLQEPATSEDLRKAIIGPSGNLRAPSIWVGDQLCVGFHPDMYSDTLA